MRNKLIDLRADPVLKFEHLTSILMFVCVENKSKLWVFRGGKAHLIR